MIPAHEELKYHSQVLRVLATKVELCHNPGAIILAVKDVANVLIDLNVLAENWQRERNNVYESKTHQGGAL